MSDAKAEIPSTDGVGDQHQFSYTNLCKDHFRSSNPVPHFSRKEPRSPLLKSTPDTEFELILRVWKTMNRFSNDSAGEEKQHAKKTSSKSRQQKKPTLPVMSRLREELLASKSTGRPSNGPRTSEGDTLPNDAKKPGSQEVHGTGTKSLKDSVRKRLSLVSTDRREEVINIDDEIQTGFDQTQFIIGVGILREDLRDELYCQILRQLTSNTMKNGRNRLQMLLHLTIGTYPPSEKLLPYIAKFIDDDSSAHSSPMKKLLARVQGNGARFQPPSKIEYTAVLKKQPLDLHVTLMNGVMHSISSDPCTTSGDVIRSVAEEIELEDTFGFSLFIAMENKISSLGSTGDKAFDAVSQCEQVHRVTSSPEAEDVPWRLFIRKEMFSPWDDVTGNPTATNLVYSQIVRGIMLGEYVCDHDTDLAAVAAMQYYVEYENDVSEDSLYSALPYYIPSHKLTGEDSIRIWCKQVAKFLKRMIAIYAQSDDGCVRKPDDVKAELVTWAKRKWTKSFCRHFDVRRLEGPRWSTDWLVLGVNSKGISLTTVKGDVGIDATYPQIASIMGESESHESKSKTLSGSVIIIVFADGTLIKCRSSDANDIYRLIKSNMAGLVERSTWAVAKEEFHDSTNKYLSCVEGDLIQLTSPAVDEALSSTDCECSNMANDEEGKMLTSMIHILPCVDEPHDDILRLFRPPNYCTGRAARRSQKTQETSVEVHDRKLDRPETEPAEALNAHGSSSSRVPADPLYLNIFKGSEGHREQRTAAVESKDEISSGPVEALQTEGRAVEDEEKEEDDDANELGFGKDFFSALNAFKDESNGGSDVPKEQANQSSYA